MLLFIWFTSLNSCLQFTLSDWKPKLFISSSKIFTAPALLFIHIVCKIFFSNRTISNRNSSLNLTSICWLNLQEIFFGFGLIFNIISSHTFCYGSKSLIDLQIWFDLSIDSFTWIDLEENLDILLVFLWLIVEQAILKNRWIWRCFWLNYSVWSGKFVKLKSWTFIEDDMLIWHIEAYVLQWIWMLKTVSIKIFANEKSNM